MTIPAPAATTIREDLALNGVFGAKVYGDDDGSVLFVDSGGDAWTGWKSLNDRDECHLRFEHGFLAVPDVP